MKLDEHPNGFPAVDDRSDLRLLANYLHLMRQALAASHLQVEIETAVKIAEKSCARSAEINGFERPAERPDHL
jgi:hypothetical protein